MEGEIEKGDGRQVMEGREDTNLKSKRQKLHSKCKNISYEK